MLPAIEKLDTSGLGKGYTCPWYFSAKCSSASVLFMAIISSPVITTITTVFQLLSLSSLLSPLLADDPLGVRCGLRGPDFREEAVRESATIMSEKTITLIVRV